MASSAIATATPTLSVLKSVPVRTTMLALYALKRLVLARFFRCCGCLPSTTEAWTFGNRACVNTRQRGFSGPSSVG